MPPPSSSAQPTLIDADSRSWLECLRADGQVRNQAIERLHALLLRAARFEVARRRGGLPQLDRTELDDIALQSADDALLAVLAKLAEFRGTSRFTTWAYKFALLETAVKLRRRPWQEREIPVEPGCWPELSEDGRSPQVDAEQGELLAAVAAAIRTELTPHQRAGRVRRARAGRRRGRPGDSRHASASRGLRSLQRGAQQPARANPI